MPKRAVQPGTGTWQFAIDDEDVQLFCDEASEQIEVLDAGLVALEGAPDAELIQRIFRAAHTLKGSSLTIGHSKMASLTHAMETVLDAVRGGHRSPSREMIDALLAGVDALRGLAEEVTTRIDSGVDVAPLEAALLAILDTSRDDADAAVPTGTRAIELSDDDRTALARLTDRGSVGLLIAVTIANSSQLPSVRCFQALQELDALGTVIRTRPERAIVEAAGAEFVLEAVIATTAVEAELRMSLESLSDVDSVTVSEFGVAKPVGELDRTPARPRLSVVPTGQGIGPPTPRAKRASQSVRIDVERLDGLMNLAGELVIDRTRLQQIREQLTQVLKNANLNDLLENLEETTAHLARVTDELQEEIMRSRMLPVRSVLTRLPRLVRDVAAKCGKQVEFTLAGEDTELDRSVIEEVSDPLVHLLRNAVDHGIERPEARIAAGKPGSGRISVTAWNQESFIYLSVKDDGGGIDTAALRRKAVECGLVARDVAEMATDEQVLQYIFFPGLSTVSAISDVSGRGVGMDIVRTNIEHINGHVSVNSTPGRGSEFIIQLPLTLATTKALMVMSNGTVYALPLVSVTEALTEDGARISSVTGVLTLRLREKLLPVVDLARALGDERPTQIGGGRYVVAVRHGQRHMAFMVDRLLGEQDIVVKALGDVVGNRKGLTGATILGDGTLGLIVDVASLVIEQLRASASA